MKALRNLCIIGIIAIAASTFSVRADIIVTVNGTRYEVSTVTTTFNAYEAQFEAQPFYHNLELATELASAVGAQFGEVNLAPDVTGGFYESGPLFAVSGTSVESDDVFDNLSSNPSVVGSEGFLSTSTYTYATASLVPETPSRVVNLALGLPFLGLVVARLVQRHSAAPRDA